MLATDPSLSWIANPGSEGLKITMMSRKGLLPEADFHHPIPYEPLHRFTEEAVDELIDAGANGLLDRTFALFWEALVEADPDYAQGHGGGVDIEAFCEGYFAERLSADPFAWAQSNLEVARADFATETVVQWRYMILRAHEVFARVVPHLNDDDLERFSTHLQPIFTDNYATIPHSIERLLALHRAGALEILAVGKECRLDTHARPSGAIATIAGDKRRFPAFIEATGQRPLEAAAFPFQSC